MFIMVLREVVSIDWFWLVVYFVCELWWYLMRVIVLLLFLMLVLVWWRFRILVVNLSCVSVLVSVLIGLMVL